MSRLAAHRGVPGRDAIAGGKAGRVGHVRSLSRGQREGQASREGEVARMVTREGLVEFHNGMPTQARRGGSITPRSLSNGQLWPVVGRPLAMHRQQALLQGEGAGRWEYGSCQSGDSAGGPQEAAVEVHGTQMGLTIS